MTAIAPPSAEPTRRTSTEWLAHFRANASDLLPIPWERGGELSGAERRAVVRSIQVFQLGESSDGRRFLRLAHDHARRAGDPDYAEAAALFIGEEHRHALDLRRFLALNGSGPIGRSAADSIFRALRHLAGLEVSIAVLITAEVVAQVYYAALREATNSAILRRLCDQILADEAEHVRFQAERLARLRARRPAMLDALGRLAHRAFFAGTCLVVWLDHRAALRAGGLGFGGFWREAWRAFGAALRRMRPGRVVGGASAGSPRPHGAGSGLVVAGEAAGHEG